MTPDNAPLLPDVIYVRIDTWKATPLLFPVLCSPKDSCVRYIRADLAATGDAVGDQNKIWGCRHGVAMCACTTAGGGVGPLPNCDYAFYPEKPVKAGAVDAKERCELPGPEDMEPGCCEGCRTKKERAALSAAPVGEE